VLLVIGSVITVLELAVTVDVVGILVMVVFFYFNLAPCCNNKYI